VAIALDGFLRKFLLKGGFDIDGEGFVKSEQPQTWLEEYDLPVRQAGTSSQPLMVAEDADEGHYKA
jgi:hypothetical protein